MKNKHRFLWNRDLLNFEASEETWKLIVVIQIYLSSRRDDKRFGITLPMVPLTLLSAYELACQRDSNRKPARP